MEVKTEFRVFRVMAPLKPTLKMEAERSSETLVSNYTENHEFQM
jgi:hypothetical protein